MKSVDMPTTAEKLAAAVAEKRRAAAAVAFVADQEREVLASKRRAAALQAQQQAAAEAAAAAHAVLKASTFRMPEDSRGSSNSRTPRRRMRRGHPGTERLVPSVSTAPLSTGSASPAEAPSTAPVVAPESAIFVHFIPPPLRARDKPDLPWIVHTCNGSGCREAKHVSFHSVTGFSTYEGVPPEVEEGVACGCQVANHHLRGHGTVRWEGDHAIVEDDAALSSIDGRAYMARAKKLGGVVASSREQIKALRASEQVLKKKVEELRIELAGRGVSLSQLEAVRRARDIEVAATDVDPSSAVRPVDHCDTCESRLCTAELLGCVEA